MIFTGKLLYNKEEASKKYTGFVHFLGKVKNFDYCFEQVVPFHQNILITKEASGIISAFAGRAIKRAFVSTPTHQSPLTAVAS